MTHNIYKLSNQSMVSLGPHGSSSVWCWQTSSYEIFIKCFKIYLIFLYILIFLRVLEDALSEPFYLLEVSLHAMLAIMLGLYDYTCGNHTWLGLEV